MRNTIKVLDPSWPRLDILALQPGELFQYKDRKSDDAVYMKIDGTGKGNSAVLLSTGMLYDITADTSLNRVSRIQIGASS